MPEVAIAEIHETIVRQLPKDCWNKLKMDINSELEETLLGQLHCADWLSFEPGENIKVAVKTVDDRGIKSLKAVALP